MTPIKTFICRPRSPILALSLLAGCVTAEPVNESFPVTYDRAEKILNESSARPTRLARPVVVIGGWLDPGFAAWMLSDQIKSATGDGRVIGVPVGFGVDFDDYRRRIVDAVQKAYPSPDAAVTTEVDVVGYSMGGLAARYAATPVKPGTTGRRLRIARLFTISSPLYGAVVTERRPSLVEPFQTDMKPGSAFIKSIDGAQPDVYPVYSYVCLGDDEIGESSAAVAGATPWWVSRPIWIDSHDWAFLDRRIRADIVRRLRGETPLTTNPPAPIPTAG